MTETTELFKATDALPSAREAASSDDVPRPQRLVELEKNSFRGDVEEQVRAATDELRKRRREQGVSARDVYDVPIVERTVSPETRGALQDDTKETALRRVSRDLTD